MSQVGHRSELGARSDEFRGQRRGGVTLFGGPERVWKQDGELPRGIGIGGRRKHKVFVFLGIGRIISPKVKVHTGSCLPYLPLPKV